MKNRKDGRLMMVGVYALMLCICVGLSATFLRTLGLNDDVYRFTRELLTEHTTGLFSILLYGVLGVSIGIRVWAAYKRHHDIKWFSTGNIVIVTVLYLFTAFCLSGADEPIAMNATLHPLFWITDNIVVFLLCVVAAIGTCTIAYYTYRGVVRLRQFLSNRRPIDDAEINRFARDFNSLTGDLRKHPELRKTCDALQRQQDEKTN